MAIDYKRIAEENIVKYGTDIGRVGRMFLDRLYSDPTHFVYELLQNAEDVGATTVTFSLFRDRLEVRHYNGRPFNQEDVRGICGLAEGTKTGDLTQIGKFGIGFKSVYAYTSSPEIHSGDQHFRIDSYVRPRDTRIREVTEKETLFVIRFDREDMPATSAFMEIGARLAALGPRTLLFLRHIEEISWSIENGDSGTYLRETRVSNQSRRISVIGEAKGNETEEEWLVFDRSVESETGADLKVEAAFLLVRIEKTEGEVVSPVAASQLVVFFPTEKETHLKFLIQGPYRTTPARDNIPKDDKWNRNLVDATARLVVESLFRLKEMGLLTVDLLDSLPISASDFPAGEMFRPIFDAVRVALLEHLLLPTADGRFVAAKHAKLARGGDLRRLLSEQQLSEIFGVDGELKWLSDDITQDRTPALRSYLRQELSIDEVTPEVFATRFTGPFVERQSDEWLVRLYGFLSGQEALWRNARGAWERSGPLRDKPFIRLQDGIHVSPFRDDGSPNAYLAPKEETGFPTVKREITQEKAAKAFLERLGLSEPDIVAEVLENILPKYESALVGNITDREHGRDIQRICNAFGTDSLEKRERLKKRLQETGFLRAMNAHTAHREFKRPGQVYVRTTELETYFAGYSDAWFLDELESIRPHAEELGVADKPRRIAVAATLSWQEEWSLREGDGRGYSFGGSTDYVLDGLDAFISKIEQKNTGEAGDLSLLLWNLLRSCTERPTTWQRADFFHGEYHWQYYRERISYFDAKFLKLLKSARWLAGSDGELHRPSQLTISGVAEGLAKDDWLAGQLGIQPDVPDVVDELARALRVDPTDIAYFLKYKSEIMDFKKWRDEQNEREQANANESDKAAVVSASNCGESEGDAKNLDYGNALEVVFSRPGKDGEPEVVLDGPLGSPERRREKVAAEIREGIEDESSIGERFKKVPVIRWEAKNNEVRAFLREQYGGNCQVCYDSFPKRDGKPYFEGLYLVSHTRTSWVDRPGNVLCLCATCCAKFLHGSVEAPDLLEQIRSFRALREGGSGEPALQIQLCGKTTKVRFTEKHMLDLQELLQTSATLGS